MILCDTYIMMILYIVHAVVITWFQYEGDNKILICRKTQENPIKTTALLSISISALLWKWVTCKKKKNLVEWESLFEWNTGALKWNKKS